MFADPKVNFPCKELLVLLLLLVVLVCQIKPDFQLHCEGAPNSISAYRLGDRGSLLVVHDYPSYGFVLPVVKLVPLDEANSRSLFRTFRDLNPNYAPTAEFGPTDDDRWTVEWTNESKHFCISDSVSQNDSPACRLATQLLKAAGLTHRYTPPA
jgi:hypothetical protein